MRSIIQIYFGIILYKNYHLYQIDGLEDNSQLITHLYPVVALVNLVKIYNWPIQYLLKERGLPLLQLVARWLSRFYIFNGCKK